MTSARLPRTGQPTSLYRLAQRARDVELVQRTGPLIDELGTALDLRLRSEGRLSERMRLLRDTTNQITRATNDAIHAYRRVRRAIALDLESPRADTVALTALGHRLSAARADILAALDAANRRYPWSDLPDGQPGQQSGWKDPR